MNAYDLQNQLKELNQQLGNQEIQWSNYLKELSNLQQLDEEKLLSRPAFQKENTQELATGLSTAVELDHFMKELAPTLDKIPGLSEAQKKDMVETVKNTLNMVKDFGDSSQVEDATKMILDKFKSLHPKPGEKKHPELENLEASLAQISMGTKANPSGVPIPGGGHIPALGGALGNIAGSIEGTGIQSRTDPDRDTSMGNYYYSHTQDLAQQVNLAADNAMGTPTLDRNRD